MENDTLWDLLAPPVERDALPGRAATLSAAGATLYGGTIHEADLAALVGISANRIRTLTRDGVLRRVAPAQYDLQDAVRSYCANLRDKAARIPAADDPIKAEKLRIATAQATALELKNAAARGEMLPAAAVEREWTNILRDVRSTLLAVPSRCGATLPHLTAHDVAAIDLEIKAALEGLADGD